MNRKRLLGLIPFAVCVAALCLALSLALRSVRTGGGGGGLGKSFDFDVEAFRRIDPELMICRELAALPVDVVKPEGLAVDRDDRIYVCGRDGLVVLDRGGETLSRMAFSGQAHCLTVDGDGTIYLGIDDHVEILNPDGTRRALWTLPQTNALPASLAVKGDGVYLTDAANGTLLHYQKSGRLVSKVGGFVMFSSSRFDLAVDPDGFLWVVNPGARELRKYSDDGEVVASWRRIARTIHGFSGCCNPMEIAIRRDGSIVTGEKNIIRVKVLDSQGRLLGVVAGPDDFAADTAPLDLAVDSGDRILVLDPARGAVRVFVNKP